MVDDGLVPLLAEQVAYYRARAPEYLEGTLDLPGGEQLEEALETFAATGDVLELACGPGSWTLQLLRHATTVTAIDASPEMLAIARERVGDDRVRFVLADLFTGVRTGATTSSSSGSGSRTSHSSASLTSGRLSMTAWRPPVASSSLTTRTAPPTSSSKAQHRRPFAGG